MLRYAKGPTPSVLPGWQATPHATWDSLPGNDKDGVRDAILRDQGRLCAYCQRRIPSSDGRMKVEHWRAQSGGSDMLRWTNLLGVCLGDETTETGSLKGERHCDTSRGDVALFLHPVEGQGPSPRDHLTYSAEGEVRPKDSPLKKSVKSDIDALNMNAVRLRRERRIVRDELSRRLERAGWTAKALRDEHRAAHLQPGVRAPAQCEVVRYHVERWARQRDLTL